MAKTYQVTAATRIVNGLMQTLIGLGIGPKELYMLTVKGRKSGKPRSTPVTLVIEGERRWLVSPYGMVNWAYNVRAAGRATLTQGRRTETVELTELVPEESAPILKRYLTDVAIVRPYFDVQPDSPLEAFIAAAPHHPVFAIHPAA